MLRSRVPYRLADAAPGLRPPAPGKRLIVSVVLNVEDWRFDAPMPRSILPPPHGTSFVPDVPNFSWAAWGMRLGLPRIIRLLESMDVPASVNLNASVIDSYPEAADRLLETGWELVGHGLDQRSLHRVDDEPAVIRETLEKIEAFSGRKVRGWLGPGLQETGATPDVLSALGVDYVTDWVVDEIPVWLDASPRPLVAVPYSLELNDSVLYAVEHHESAELLRRVTDTLQTWDAEDDDKLMVLTLPLHPHLIGVRHRLGYLRASLELLLARPDTIVMTGEQICDWFLEQSPR
ncbi:polysaccharide deacetylase family protein [Microbacterium sp. X-17]|uniref:polysaccharide deacetylase family protein n=1 Tax=Microbacterium sp. X-17 TaxID=3144404 RepID=UPI0031F4A469